MSSKRTRCAIYTRKSSEEGLEQSFNSLEAQREACRAFILSQKNEGWSLVPNRYDDGGFSGGTMDRPALSKLFTDIRACLIDTVVVYKVDRLTRSLMDFAKMIDLFDSHSVSFVSVTQQFNTTTSMGRLTLNVLLSFAQFEREVTGERIRDKIAASKKKGMWMGGFVPFGYDRKDRSLVINHDESPIVLEIFRQYDRLGSVRELRNWLKEKNIRSKIHHGTRGQIRGGNLYSRGALYHLLNNRIYRGEIVHRGQSFAGQHQSIVPRELWDRVAARLKQNNQANRTQKAQSTPSLLAGKLFDVNGVRFTPTHSVKSGKRYRYYTSQSVVTHTGAEPTICRFPATELEKLVASQIETLLHMPEKLAPDKSPSGYQLASRARKFGEEWSKLRVVKQHEFIRSILKRVTIGDENVWIEIDKNSLLAKLGDSNSTLDSESEVRGSGSLKLETRFQAVRGRGEIRMVPPNAEPRVQGEPEPSLVKPIVRAYYWQQKIVRGNINSIAQLADENHLSRRYVRKVLQLARLSPKVVEAILAGNHRRSLTLNDIQSCTLLSWPDQEQKLLSIIWY